MLSEEAIDDLVRRAMAGEGSLDELTNGALFPDGGMPARWADWPQEARDGWDAVMRRHGEITAWLAADAAPLPQRPQAGAVSVEAAWSAIAPYTDPLDWRHVPGLTWRDLAPVLGLSVRAIHYQLCDLQGWRFSGAGWGADRHIVRAPCVACGKPKDAEELEGRTCRACREAGTSTANPTPRRMG